MRAQCSVERGHLSFAGARVRIGLCRESPHRYFRKRSHLRPARDKASDDLDKVETSSRLMPASSQSIDPKHAHEAQTINSIFRLGNPGNC